MSALQRRDGRDAVGADGEGGAVGDVVPAGARGDVQVRFDDDGAQRLVRDAAAVALCMENGIPIKVFNLKVQGNIQRVVLGEDIGSLVSAGERRS